MAHRLEQALHLVVLALVQGDLQPRVVVLLDHPHVVHRHPGALDAHARAQPGQGLRVGNAVHLGVVHPGHLVARVRDALREGAVVGHEDDALRGDVEPTHREQARHRGHEVHDGLAPFRIVAGGDDALGLVEEKVDGGLGGGHPHAVHPDVVLAEIGLGAQLPHHLAVDREPALGHHLLGAAPRGEAGPGKNLLKSLLHDVGRAGRREAPRPTATPPSLPRVAPSPDHVAGQRR